MRSYYTSSSKSMFSGIIFGLLYVLSGLVSAEIDPYLVLGVSKDADDKTIKSAYRQLSKQYHPDKNPSAEAHQRFIEIGDAYEILSDEQKKLNYDQFGDPNGAGVGGGFHFNDIFNQFFNGHGGNPANQGKRTGQDALIDLYVTLKEFYTGRDLDFSVEMNNICEACEGTGSADGQRHQCSKCQGSGVVTIRTRIGPMIQQFQSHCDQCGGQGSTIAHLCGTCGGKGIRRKKRSLNVFLSAGTPRNHVTVLEGEGDQHPDFLPGNMNVRFMETLQNNWGFYRIGDNLYRTEALTSNEAFSGGWRREIRMFDDEVVVVERKKGVPVIDGHVDVIHGHGMPKLDDNSEFGNLYVKYTVVPVRPSITEKDEL